MNGKAGGRGGPTAATAKGRAMAKPPSYALFVVSAASYWTLKDGTRHPTGFWAEELVVPHRILSDAGYDITISTPGGVPPTADRASLMLEFNDGDKDKVDALTDYLASIGAPLESPARLEDVAADESIYDVIFYPGGHGPMEDLAVNETSGDLLTRRLDSGRLLALLCHAPAALLPAKRPNGDWPFRGYLMTAFTNAEEEAVGLASKAKWLLQDRLVEKGADFDEGAPWLGHVVDDRNLHTGQNPASSELIANKLVRVLEQSR
ncbi:ThiJ/PfpI domain-containing protein [Streptomyces violaceusniger Tu 4113]|uniref:ThiJ/PfpI domain-containing protein n=2 Tax=Streptomyces violaceusniger TaxID=68280 RepID=G2P6I4_STRV4|nr:ThiJ/PfpI domain-containing protein [Streptomyces violaceusniger Tu 4113]